MVRYLHHPGEAATTPPVDPRLSGLACLGLVWLGLWFGCAGPSAGRRTGSPTIEVGKATYYAPRLAGHKTANGERYDPTAMTAAHPSLPFGSRVRVTRLDDESRSVSGRIEPRSVSVRINDRCAGGKKIIDLSEAAARRLGMLRAGIVPVRIVPTDAN